MNAPLYTYGGWGHVSKGMVCKNQLVEVGPSDLCLILKSCHDWIEAGQSCFGSPLSLQHQLVRTVFMG